MQNFGKPKQKTHTAILQETQISDERNFLRYLCLFTRFLWSLSSFATLLCLSNGGGVSVFTVSYPQPW
jgi:hypothetical protein